MQQGDPLARRGWLARLWARLRAVVGGRLRRDSRRSRPFHAGFAAFRSGLALADNPHPRGERGPWLDWRRGYLAGQARAERRQALIDVGQDSDSHFDLPIVDPRR